jgi:hypothetical protein
MTRPLFYAPRSPGEVIADVGRQGATGALPWSVGTEKRPVLDLRERVAQLLLRVMTMGPYQATGSPSGWPETSRNRIRSVPAWISIWSPWSKRTTIRF